MKLDRVRVGQDFFFSFFFRTRVCTFACCSPVTIHYRTFALFNLLSILVALIMLLFFFSLPSFHCGFFFLNLIFFLSSIYDVIIHIIVAVTNLTRLYVWKIFFFLNESGYFLGELLGYFFFLRTMVWVGNKKQKDAKESTDEADVSQFDKWTGCEVISLCKTWVEIIICKLKTIDLRVGQPQFTSLFAALFFSGKKKIYVSRLHPDEK